MKRDDLAFSAPVGPDSPNKLRDLVGAKKALSNTGLIDFDVTREPSHQAGSRFTDAVKEFQRAKGLKVDGLMNPEGPTIRAMRDTLFPPGTASNIGQPVDLKAESAAQPRRSLIEKAGTAAGENGAHEGRQLAQANTPQQSGAPIGSGINTPSGPINWNPIVTKLLQREGGFNPNDPSNRGVRRKRLRDHLRRKGTPKDGADLDQALHALTEAEAREVYDDIIARRRVDQIPDVGLAEQVFDGVVNSGGHGIEHLQVALEKVLGPQGPTFVDGSIGPRTLGAIDQVIQTGRLKELRNEVVDERVRFITKSVKRKFEQQNDPKKQGNTVPTKRPLSTAQIEALIEALTRRAKLFRP